MMSNIVLQLLLGSLAAAQHIVVEVGQPGTFLLSVGNSTVQIVVNAAKTKPGLTLFDGLLFSLGVSSILAIVFVLSSVPFRQYFSAAFAKLRQPALYSNFFIDKKPPQPPRRKNAYVDTAHFSLGADKFMIMKSPSDPINNRHDENIYNYIDDENIYDYIDDNLVGRSQL